MIPLFFGPPERRKYGVFQPAIGVGNKGRAVVICDALFDEALCAHRAIRFAADGMAKTRWSSLRFDYFGTGDSAGETSDFSITQALIDIEDAVEELKFNARVQEVYLLGLRLGGTLAIHVAARRSDIRGTALWDPVIDGNEVLQRYEASADANTRDPHVAGYRLPEQAQSELRSLSIREQLHAIEKPILMVCTAPTDTQRRLATQSQCIDFREIDAPEAWSNTPLGGVRPIPTAVVETIQAWQRR